MNVPAEHKDLSHGSSPHKREFPINQTVKKDSLVLLKSSFKQTRSVAIFHTLCVAHPYETLGCTLKSTVMLTYKGLCSTESSLYEQEFSPSVFHVLDT